MVDIFLDTSVFIEHILGNFSIEKLVNKDRLFSSINVLEETFYKSIILKTFEKFGKISKYTAKKKYIKNTFLYSGNNNTEIKEMLKDAKNNRGCV